MDKEQSGHIPGVVAAALAAAVAACLAIACALVAPYGVGAGYCDHGEDASASEGASASPNEQPADWATWTNMMEAVDLDGDGRMESVELADRRLGITARDAATGAFSTMQTDEGWQVSNCFIADMVGDGTPEIVLLTWAEGSYGTSKPFWVEEDDAGLCQHVYLFHYEEGGLVPVWMSSELEAQITSASMDAQARLHLVDVEGTETVWIWEGFGLKLAEEHFADGTEGESSQAADAARGASQSDGASASGLEGADTQSATETGVVSLLAVGDNLVHDATLAQCRKSDGTYDFSSAYSTVAGWVSSYDISAVGQETVLSDAGAASGNPPFRTPTSMGDALAGAGFNTVLLANNHADDQGVAAIRSELSYWEDAHPEVTVLGAHEPTDDARYRLVERNGVRLALFDYTAGLGTEAVDGADGLVDTLDEQARLIDDLQDVVTDVDFSICFLHIGDEMSSTPSAEQRNLCAELIDAGADVVICAHAHVVAPFERVTTAAGASGIVYYGLGNFISNQLDPTTALEAAASLILRVRLVDGVRVATVEVPKLVPLVCHVDGSTTQVRFLADYDDAQASQHALHSVDVGFSRTYLANLWNDIVVSGKAS